MGLWSLMPTSITTCTDVNAAMNLSHATSIWGYPSPALPVAGPLLKETSPSVPSISSRSLSWQSLAPQAKQHLTPYREASLPGDWISLLYHFLGEGICQIWMNLFEDFIFLHRHATIPNH